MHLRGASSLSLLLQLQLAPLLMLAPLLPCVATSDGPSLSSYMVGNWRVIAGPPICDQNSCCCFTSDVNIFATPGSGELNLNGTVAGTYCNQPIRQDNINPPASLSFTEEFFGINNYTFTLANASSAGQGLRLTAIDNNSGFSRCSFVMYCATCDFILPGYTLPAAAPPPSVAQPYVGDWAFDTSTCDANSCCCMTGNATVFVDPDGAPTLHISSSGSAGCPVSDSIEDDFPFPSSGTATSSFSVAQGFLPNQDTFNISLLASNTNFILSFTDETAPACSMRATRPMPVSSSPIVFGRSASITGVDDVDGLAIEAAYSYWVNWTNNVRGGIRIDGVRHPVKLIQYNDASDATLIPLIYDHLALVDNVTALFSPFTSSLVSAAQSHAAGLPIMLAGPTSDSLFGAYPNSFGMGPPSSMRSLSCLAQLLGAGARTMSVAYTAGNVFNAQTASQLIALARAQGMRLLSNDSFASGATNFSALVSQWVALNPDVLVISGTSPDPWTIIQQVRGANWWPKQIYLPTASALLNTIQEAAGSAQEWAMEYVLSSDTWRPDQPGSDPFFGSPAGFAAAYENATGQPALSSYVSAFAAGYVISSAIEAANSLNPALITAALRNTNLTFWYGTDVQFYHNGAPDINYTCVQVQSSSIRTINGPGGNASTAGSATVAQMVYPAVANAPAGFYTPSAPPAALPTSSERPDAWIWQGVIIGLGFAALCAAVVVIVIRKKYSVHFLTRDRSGAAPQYLQSSSFSNSPTMASPA